MSIFAIYWRLERAIYMGILSVIGRWSLVRPKCDFCHQKKKDLVFTFKKKQNVCAACNARLWKTLGGRSTFFEDRIATMKAQETAFERFVATEARNTPEDVTLAVHGQGTTRGENVEADRRAIIGAIKILDGRYKGTMRPDDVKLEFQLCSNELNDFWLRIKVTATKEQAIAMQRDLVAALHDAGLKV